MDVNRYAPKPIIGDNLELKDLRLTGEFPAGDTGSIIFTLKEVFHLEVQELANEWRVRRIPNAPQ